MTADRFWHRPGVISRLREDGWVPQTPNRLPRPASWEAEAAHLARLLPDGPVPVIAASNGASVGVRLALAHPARVSALVLAWPATAGDPQLDQATRVAHGPGVEPLLAGETLRGVRDDELARLRLPVAVVPAPPESPWHQRHTADALLKLVPDAVELPVFPETPHPGFAGRAGEFSEALAGFLRSRTAAS
ncbi:alpha/beta fold hydrolase [Streptacidiphilus monticola]